MPILGDKIRISSGGSLSTAERYLERALDYYERKKYNEALADLDEALRYERRNAELYATRGYILQEMDATEEAETDFARALKLDPSQWIVHYAHAMQAFAQGDFVAALQHLSLGQKSSGFRPELFIYRAAAYYHLGDKKHAEAEISAAIQAIDEQLRADPENKRLKTTRTQAAKWQGAIKKMR